MASSYFDGIAYQKGALVLKQLNFLMGSNFTNGIVQYFKTYKLANTTIDDLFNAMSPFFSGFTFTIGEWRQMWFETSSFNVLEAEWDPFDISSVANLIIRQTSFTSA